MECQEVKIVLIKYNYRKAQLQESSVAGSSNKSNKHATGEHGSGYNLIVGSLNNSNKQVTREHKESSITENLNKSNKHSYCYTWA